MSRNIRAIAQLKKNTELYNLFIIIGILVIDTILYVIFRAAGVSGEAANEDYFEIIYGMSAGIFIAVVMFVKLFMVADEVSRGLCFGMTRRVLFSYSRIVDLLEVLVIAGFSMIIMRGVSGLLILKIAFTFYGIMMLVEGLAGNNVIRYGKVAFWVFYFGFIFFLMCAPRLIGWIPGGENLAALFVDMYINPFYNQLIVWASILGFNIIGLLINWLTFRTLAVRVNV